MFKVSLKTVDGWWAKWRAGGREALTARPRGKRVGDHQVLSEAEQAALRQAVLDHRPCDVGLSGQLWTRGQVGVLIAKLYRVRLTEPGVGKYLKRWGLSFQRPDKRAVEQDPGGGAGLAGGDLAGDPREGEGRGRRGPLRRPGRHLLRPGQRPHLGRAGPHPDRAADREPDLGERDISDQHEGPYALHGVHRELRRARDVSVPRPPCRPLRPQDLPRGGPALRPPLPHGPRLAGRSRRPARAALPAVVLTRAEPRRTRQRRPQTQPAREQQSTHPGPTRQRDPMVLAPPPAAATHRPQLLPRPPRPLHPRREPFEFPINRSGAFGARASCTVVRFPLRR